jgi:hypothetical protein
VLGGIYIFMNRQTTPPSVPSKVYIWNIKDSELLHVLVVLPREGKSEAFIKISQGDKFPWFFDDQQKSPVDSKIWGGGIPLILSGPSADRVITEDVTDEQLKVYGLFEPSMEITLTLANGDVLKIEAGDSTPNRQNYYIRVSNSNTIATIDASWYQVLERLVLEPPYASIQK